MYQIWETKKTFCNSFTVQGGSVSGQRSGFYIPEFKIMFDAGIYSQFSPEIICITHTHADHIQALPDILTGIETQPKILVPRGTKNLITNYILAHFQLTRSTTYDVSRDFEIIEVEPGETIRFGEIELHILETEHYTTENKRSVGYALHAPLIFYYIGDSNITWTAKNEILENAVILCESTYLLETEIKNNNHTSLDKIAIVAERNPKTTFMLTHWNSNYSQETIRESVKKYHLTNLQVW